MTVDDAVTSCTPCNEGEFHADGFVLDMSDFAKEGWNNVSMRTRKRRMSVAYDLPYRAVCLE